MSEPMIVRPRLNFEAEFGQHRNWWVRDSRLTGNPLSVFLYLLSHEVSHSVTQTEAWTALGLGQRAWVSAKQVLLQCGFLVEVRDRYPDGYVDKNGNPRGRQRRFRLFLQDPEPGFQVPLVEAVIELNEPYEQWLLASQALDTALRSVEEVPDTAQRSVGKEPQVSPTLHNAVSESPTLHNAVSFIGRENQDGKDGINTFNPSHPSITERARENAPATVGIDVAELDAELAEIHPSLSVAALAREIRGRVPVESLDLVRACREILGANRQAGGVKYPPAYCAKSICTAPERWQAGLEPYLAPRPRQGGEETRSMANDCQTGNHWWGPESWGEIARSHCVNCGVPRRNVDAVYSELETELSFGGGR